MSLSQILCVKFPGREDQCRSIQTYRLFDSSTTDEINISEWTSLSFRSLSSELDQHAKAVFTIENGSENLVVIPNNEHSMQLLKRVYRDTIFLDPRDNHMLLLYYFKYKIPIQIKILWQTEDFTSFERGRGNVN